ncbi:hypothetical protein [Thiocystis violacea]|uniref:hypothetical protein n=1 Tax=Thiocystis violacea TaxID=13725 RepID=UPI00190655AB|nr:hypothetical protein [Thiocystis violacea]MBK1722404.1 hypothetical protein [Thiocystis violacea]
MPRVAPLFCLVLALTACDRSVQQAPEVTSDVDLVVVDAMDGDPFAAELRRVKDLLADGQVGEAGHAWHALRATRANLTPDRQLELDRLGALFAGMP